MRIGEYAAKSGIEGDGPYRTARDLLHRESPRVGGQVLRLDKESTVEAAARLCQHLQRSDERV